MDTVIHNGEPDRYKNREMKRELYFEFQRDHYGTHDTAEKFRVTVERQLQVTLADNSVRVNLVKYSYNDPDQLHFNDDFTEVVDSNGKTVHGL